MYKKTVSEYTLSFFPDKIDFQSKFVVNQELISASERVKCAKQIYFLENEESRT